MSAKEGLNPGERSYARGLLTVRSGKALRRSRISRLVFGSLTLVSYLGFIGLGWADWRWGVIFVAGWFAGIVVIIYLAAWTAPDRIAVMLRVCNWDEVERLLAQEEIDSKYKSDG
jgi:hypothetical protein